MNTRLMGRWGEERAAEFLKRKGYEIIAAGWQCRLGELDLIAKKRGVVVFVEVKTRKSGSFARPMEYVTASKQNKLRAAASLWLSLHDPDIPARFDVVEVAEGRINHIENAFE